MNQTSPDTPDPRRALADLIELLAAALDKPTSPLPTLSAQQIALVRTLIGDPVAKAKKRLREQEKQAENAD